MDFSITFYTSFFYIITGIHALLMNDIFYSLLFFILYTTSILFRIHNNLYTTILDKFAIALVTLYGGRLFFLKIEKNGIFKNLLMIFAILSTFLLDQ